MLAMAPLVDCMQCSVDKLLIAMLPAFQLEDCNAGYGPFGGLHAVFCG